ncbi:hypothetical protein ABT56_16860 [Photobacterium aquae]|uniref:DUF2989 domain-containing protein n=1 Tax=Photobacterium aquae TaxID=1195763 RepID=A0A0J1GW20_9GAMM|nr:DUF2989 domain-containing protein [Photobacterium aquae]KLV03903.1 hypothetical protein ABT56_16860 [Photobacterium aquae]
MNRTALYITTILATATLTGCFDRPRTTESLCEKHPEICQDTNLRDSQCRLPRTHLIWQRYDVLNTPSDLEKFKELKLTYDYQECLEYAALIEPREEKERKSRRTQALINAYTAIERLLQELSDSTEPEILYFRWGQGDHKALDQFLSKEGLPEMETPEIQFALASIYSAKDQDKTIRLLNHALELYSPDQPIKQEIIQSLATHAHQRGQSQQAFLWGRVGIELGMAVSSTEKLNAFYPMDDALRMHLEKQAVEIAKAIKQGRYREDMSIPAPLPEPELAS